MREVTNSELGVRAGRREANLRSINERVVEALDQLPDDFGDEVRLVCECAHETCEEMIEVPRAVFDRARATMIGFLVAPGHEIEEVEDAVETAERWSLVHKRGKAAQEAAARWFTDRHPTHDAESDA